MAEKVGQLLDISGFQDPGIFSIRIVILIELVLLARNSQNIPPAPTSLS